MLLELFCKTSKYACLTSCLENVFSGGFEAQNQPFELKFNILVSWTRTKSVKLVCDFCLFEVKKYIYFLYFQFLCRRWCVIERCD